MLVPDLMPILTRKGLRLATQVSVGSEIWTGTGWTKLRSISDQASARFYDYDFGTATFRANAGAQIWQPSGTKNPTQLYSLTTSLGPEGVYVADPISEWDGYFWAVGEWIDSLNKPCATVLDKERTKLLASNKAVVKLKDLYVHRDTRIPRQSYDRRAMIPSVYMHAELDQLRCFLRGYVIALVTSTGTMELNSDRHACTLQLALSAVGVETERFSQQLRFPNTVQVNRVLKLELAPREDKVKGNLRAVLAKGELKCFEWDVDACWMSGIVLKN